MPNQNPKDIYEESGLNPNQWQAIDSAIKPAPPSVGDITPVIPQYFSGSLDPSIQHDVDFVNTALRSSSAPRFALMPPGIQSSALTSAQLTSAIKTNAPASTGGGSGITSLTLTAPKEINVAGSPTSGTTPEIDLTWAPEPALTTFSGPGSTAVGFDGAFFASITSAGPLTTIGGTPSLASGEYAVYIASGVQTTSFIPFTGSTPTGWTALAGSVGVFPQFARALTSAASVTETWAVGSARVTSMIVYLAGALPAFSNSASAITGPSPISAALTGMTIGNSILVLCSAQIATPVTTGILTDSQLNTPILLGTVGIPVSGGGARGSQVFVYLIPSVTGSSDTVTFSVSPNSASSGLQMALYEIPPSTPIAAVPRFQPFPPVNVSSAIGILSPVNGGTGAALNATGGTSQVLQQTTLGGAVTVGQLAASNLSNGTTGSGAVALASAPTVTNPVIAGRVTSYNGTATVSGGIASEVKTVDLINQAAAITATNLTTTAPGGMARISWVATVTQAATLSSVLGGTNGFQIIYTDQDTSVVKTTPGAIVAGVDTNSNNSTATGTISGCIIVNTVINSTIQYQMDYTSSGVTPMQYNLHIKLENM